MIKLLIVDDEKIIRETIASLIDWASLEISLVGTAENGIEAYNMILDDYPDIVLTDIKMPGLSGLDLIQRIREINPDTQFVILSGYGEFKFAQRAMQYGVKHYLLKPCNEEQIIKSLTSAKKDYLEAISAKTDLSAQQTAVDQLVMKNILTYYLQNPAQVIEKNLSPYQQYTDVAQKSYILFYIYFVSADNYLPICIKLQEAVAEFFPEMKLHLFYVKGTIVCFFLSDQAVLQSILEFLKELKKSQMGKLSEYKMLEYDTLHMLMIDFVKHIKNYEMVYQILEQTSLPIYNYRSVVKEMHRLVDLAFSMNQESSIEALNELFVLLNDISDLDLLRQQAFTLIISAVSKQNEANMAEAMKYLLSIYQLENADSIRLSLHAKLTDLFENYHDSYTHTNLSQRIIAYTEQNLEKSGLSLKWIAENYLFMNVDYLSKRFAKETGMKFSKYLTDLRIQKAKYYMELGSYTIQEVAELVGCGQNPQYFSQIFKKNTGVSPSQYLMNFS